MLLACLINDPTSKVSILWKVLAITVFFSARKLLISTLRLFLMAKLLPQRITGFAIGAWFITSAILRSVQQLLKQLQAGFNNDESKGFDDQMTVSSFHKYQKLFDYVSLVAIVFAIIAFVIGKKINKMIQNLKIYQPS